MELQSIKNRFGIIGNDPQLNYAMEVAQQVANTDLSVLIFGESGVGKEIFSQIIHNLSPRRHNAFIAVNCGAIPEGTIDSELFGHEKGSFTSATEQRKGYFEAVNGGTIFLDEIGELPLGTQARLLRVLETGEYIRVGSSKVITTNVRVIAATNKDLLTLTKENKFREDLYYRLNTVPIRVPALRERKEDIPLLFRKFANDFAEKYNSKLITLDEGAQELIKNYSWPGNVRELKNIAEQVSVLAKERTVQASVLQRFLPNVGNDRTPALRHADMPSYVGGGGQQQTNSEREILYKLFFELKRDINEVKTAVYKLSSNGAFTDHANKYSDNTEPDYNRLALGAPGTASYTSFDTPAITDYQNAQSGITIHPEGISHHEDVEETLSIEDMERSLITKALIKHRGKRKDAASELGISERTLYRKIKEFKLEE